MRKKTSKNILKNIMLVYSLVSLILVNVVCVRSNDSPIISISSFEVGVNSTISIPIIVTDASQVAGGSSNILFDQSIVEAQSVEAGDFGDPTSNIKNEEGVISIAVALPNAIGMDEATLAIVTFKGILEGETALEISSVQLSDEQGNIISSSTTNGLVTVQTSQPLTMTESILGLGMLIVPIALIAGLIIFLRRRRAKRKKTLPVAKKPTQYCMECGAAIPEDATFCEKCGEEITAHLG